MLFANIRTILPFCYAASCDVWGARAVPMSGRKLPLRAGLFCQYLKLLSD